MSKIFINPNGEVQKRVGARTDLRPETKLSCGLSPGGKIVITGQHVMENGNLMYSFVPKDVQGSEPVRLREFDPESTMWILAEGEPTQTARTSMDILRTPRGTMITQKDADGEVTGMSAGAVVPKEKLPDLIRVIDQAKEVIPNLKFNVTDLNPADQTDQSKT